MPFPGTAGSCWAADTWAADTWDADAWGSAGEAAGPGDFRVRGRRRSSVVWALLLALQVVGGLHGAL